jgi:hypothetical protein
LSAAVKRARRRTIVVIEVPPQVERLRKSISSPAIQVLQKVQTLFGAYWPATFQVHNVWRQLLVPTFGRARDKVHDNSEASGALNKRIRASDDNGTIHRQARCCVRIMQHEIGIPIMGRGLLLWLIGIPLPIILLIWLLGGLHG